MVGPNTTMECPRCHRRVGWNSEEWNSPENACVQCAPLPPNPRQVMQQKATPVVLTRIDVPFGDLLYLTFKLFLASILVGILAGGLWLFFRNWLFASGGL
jgi:hypothetical protein